jgi:hypothetical protein
VAPRTAGDYEQVPVDRLSAHPENPRRGNVDAIVASIEANGFYGAVVAQRSTGYVLVGNHRWQAAQRVGMKTVPVVWVDVDEDRARRILLVDNRSNDIAGWDDDALAALLDELAITGDALAGTGFGADELLDIAATLERKRPAEAEERYSHTTTEDLARYQEAGVRFLVLEYPMETFAQVVDALGAYRAAHELEDNPSAVAQLLGVECASSAVDVS